LKVISSSGLMPAWIFLVLLYRELGVTFLRMVLIRRGIAMAASVWGKAKAMTYALGGVLGVVYYAMDGMEAGTSLVMLVLGLAVGLPPAVRAMRLRVIDALGGHQ